MPLEIIRQFNWIDIFIVILLFRVGYAAVKSGLPAELFKLLGTLLATYLSLHYYTVLADWFLASRAELQKKAPLEFLDFISFLVLAIGGYLIFVLLRSIFYRFIKMEAVPNLNKWGGLILGIARGILLAGLIMFMLVISSASYLKKSVANSYFGRQVFAVAPSTYSALWSGLASKFMTTEKFNKTVTEIQEGFGK